MIPKSYNIQRGVPQGAVLGSLLCHIMYDAVLKIPMLTDPKVNRFADNVDEVIVVALDEGRTTYKPRNRGSSDDEQEDCGDLTVGSSESPHSRHSDTLVCRSTPVVSEKAGKMTSALARIMPNIGSPRQSCY